METHNGYPAVNVKVHGDFGPPVSAIVERFSCSEAQAGKALAFAWESAQRSFWDYWRDGLIEEQDNGIDYFPGYMVEVVCEGRSGGWLVVYGLPDPDDWSIASAGTWSQAGTLPALWTAFEAAVLADVKYRCSPEAVIEDIAANEWWREGSEQFNFSDAHPGKTVAEWNVVKDAAIAEAWERFTTAQTFTTKEEALAHNKAVKAIVRGLHDA